MALKTKVIRLGSYFVIRAIATTGQQEEKDPCDTLRFCQEIATSHPGELTKLARMWTDIAENGIPTNKEKFRNLKGTNGLYEMKTSDLRVICFFDDQSLIVCTHGFVKTSRKTPQNEIEKGKKLKRRYFDEKKKGTLEHDPIPG